MVLQKMANYEEPRVKLGNAQLNKAKSAAKYKTETALKITNKIIQDEVLPQESLLTTKQKTKMGNALANTMLTDIKQ